MTKIYLIRHCQSDTNADRIFTGQINSHLSELGNRQALTLINYFKGERLDGIYSSNLDRCIETVAPLARFFNKEITIAQGFREIYAGKWQGLSFFDIEKQFNEDYLTWRTDLANARPTDGESISELGKRAFAAFCDVVKESRGKNVVICSHSLPIRSIVAELSGGKSISDVGWTPNGSITEIAEVDGALKVCAVGIVSHLGDMITELPKNI